MRSDVCDHSFNPVCSCFIVEMAGGVKVPSNVSFLEGDPDWLVFALAIPYGFADLTDLRFRSVCPCLVDGRLGANLHEVFIGEEEGFSGPEDTVPSFGVRQEIIR